MEIKLKPVVNLFIDRNIAEKLLKFTTDNPEFESFNTELTGELAPRYEYKIKCQDCGAKYSYSCTRKLTEAETNQGGICHGCSDDYK